MFQKAYNKREFAQLLKDNGYEFVRSKGGHFIYKKKQRYGCRSEKFKANDLYQTFKRMQFKCNVRLKRKEKLKNETI